MKLKKVFIGGLALSMALSAMACGGGNSGQSASGADTSVQRGDSDTDTAQNAASGETPDSFERAEIDMEEEPYTVAIQIVTLPGTDFAGEEDREAAINEITLPAINCKVDLQEIWISEIANTTSMAVAGNEKIDLVHVATVSPLSSMVGSDILLDMNEDNLLQTHGQDLITLLGDVIEAGNVNGKQLAIPARVFNAAAKGFDYNKNLADEYGIEIPETGATIDDLENALYAIKEKDPDIMPFYVANSGEMNYLYWLQGYEYFGNEASYGVVMDSSKDLTVENLFASDEFKDYCLRMYKWKQDGIQPGDPTDTSPAQAYFEAGRLFVGGVTNIDDINKANVGAKYDFEVGWSEMQEPKITNSTVTEFMWGIAANSERPDKAMDFLNFVYTNADVANIIKYGLEGVNYEFAEGSDKVIISNGTYLADFVVIGNTSEMLIQSPGDEGTIERSMEMNERATISPICNYMFDDTQFQTESSLIYSTIMEYLPRLQNGLCDSEDATLALIDEFNQKLELAGINDVIAANQEQMDAFLAAQ